MSVAKGINSFAGTAPVESDWGTPETVDAYHRFVSQDFVPDSDETPGDDSLGLALDRKSTRLNSSH